MAKIKVRGNATKKEVILAKAAKLVRVKGFASSSMRELAEMMGVEAASLYNHIGSKAELLQTICFNVAGLFHHQLQEVVAMEGTAELKLEKLVRFHTRMMIDSYDEVFVANHEWKQMEEPFLQEFLQERKSYENILVEIVEEGIQKRELKPIHPYVAVLTILSAVRGLEFWHRQKRDLDATQLENDLVLHLLNGLIK